MRGRAHLTGSHTFRITDDGLRIYPRILPVLAEDRLPGAPVDREARRISTGVPGLDAMMHGGLPQGHTMLVAGPTGSGKTIIATRFLQEGVRLGEKGVAVYFEKGTPRLRNAELAELVQSGAVAVLESRLLDLTVDELIDELLMTLQRTGATRPGHRFPVRVRPVHGAGIPRRPAPGRVPPAVDGGQDGCQRDGDDRGWTTCSPSCASASRTSPT